MNAIGRSCDERGKQAQGRQFWPGRARGFTLVELLVVIGIIGVLMSILIASISKARRSATTMACMSNLRQIGIALRAYAVENKDSLPLGYLPFIRNSPFDSSQKVVDSVVWANFVNTYFNQTGVTRYDMYLEHGSITKAFICPEATMPDRENNYSAHTVAFPMYELVSPDGSVVPSNLTPAHFARLRSDNILVFDGAQVAEADYETDYLGQNIDEGLLYSGYYYIGTEYEEAAQAWWYLDVDDPNQNDPSLGNNYPIEPGDNDDTAKSESRIRWRHRDSKPHGKNGAANFLFGDGRVETLGQKDVLRRMLRLNR